MSDRETAPYRRIAELERENAALREQIDDWENAVLHARDNRSQEQHCTCVPPLLGKVKQLERANAELRAAIDVARKEEP
jgi:multidrug resistance efflux pump